MEMLSLRANEDGHRVWPAGLIWLIGWGAAMALDGRVDLANLAMLLVLASALASLWLPGWLSALASALAVLAFNWTFVPPRHEFTVDLRQHLLLLGSMFTVNWIISALVVTQRRLARDAQRHAQREARLRQWGDALRDASDPAAHASALHDALAAASLGPAAVIVLTRRQANASDEDGVLRVGQVDADQTAGLWLCIREGQPLGPGSGRYEEQPDAYLPLRARGETLGAAVLQGLGLRGADPELRAHAQALCDQMGLALQRAVATHEEQAAREQAQAQGVRNALLAAISHDYRTPLATIMGAASSLQEQTDRLSAEQRLRLATSIVDEAARLSRLTENTLQLARLDAPGVELRCDWESAEEIVGAVLRQVRRRDPARRVRARLEPGLPLLWCDAMLIAQMLENLVDNALKYSGDKAPVEILVRRVGEQALLGVRDRGPGIAPAWRERVFEVFRRGAEPMAGGVAISGRPGAGVGLAVCRAIAAAHGGKLKVRARGHGGSAFECLLPLRAAPEPPGPADPSTAT
jgi:two-component system sensor histidine kinase KdpD